MEMAKHATDLVICFIAVFSAIVLFALNKYVAASFSAEDANAEYSWVLHGVCNVLGYGTVLVPCYLVYRYITKVNYLEKNRNRCLHSLLKRCFGEEETSLSPSGNPAANTARTPMQDCLLLSFYFFGLQISFLSWGILQEKVMTQKYENSNDESGYFKDSQFLVFVNRILAFCMSGLVLLCKRQSRHKCPMFKYSFCSLSNIMSSWCQYEALKYVSFPHQVLAKAAKTIPVMIMGKIVSRTKYEYYEYVTAVILSIGMLFFMLDAGNDRAISTVTTISGIILLVAYIVFDSFTSNWQGSLFKQYGMSPVQMMCAVNFYSCIFTVASLLQQGAFVKSFDFMLKFPRFIIDCVLLSICSAGGQLFIFSTVASFGPLVFAIITTVRQGLSVLLSCLIYKHHIGFVAVLGLLLVFSSILLRVYCSYKLKLKRSVAITSKPV